MSFCNAKCPEECSYRLELIKAPGDTPLSDIIWIMNENVRLKKEVEHWKAKAQCNWDILETVAIGEKLFCGTCKKNHPCGCDGESKS